jgi:hypothetical protein
LVVFTGVFFGRQSGYLTGAFTALISNMILGQGAWAPWQMYAWGMMGFFAGLLAEKGAFKRRQDKIGQKNRPHGGQTGQENRPRGGQTGQKNRPHGGQTSQENRPHGGRPHDGRTGQENRPRGGFRGGAGAGLCYFPIYIYGAVASAFYGFVLDTWFITGFVSEITKTTILAAYTAGLILNLSHVLSTVLFLLFILKPWGRKIQRIKIKYGISASDVQ